MYSKDAKKIIIPEGTKEIGIEQFKNYQNLEEVVLPNSLKQIDYYAFQNCRNLKRINLPDNLRYIADGAFKDCRSLEEITIPKSVTVLSKFVFEHCISLKKLNIHDNITMIEDHALFDCRNLEDFDLPQNLDYLGRMALMGCSKIKEIHIPASLDKILVGALALIDNLEKIYVDYDNKNYCTDINNELLIDHEGVLLQAAIKSISPSYVASYIDIPVKNEETGEYLSFKTPIYSLADYAFAGCKNLKYISLLSETDHISTHTFLGCDNLKELNIFCSSFGKEVTLSIIDIFSSKDIYNNQAYIPFEHITISEGITHLFDDLCGLFKSAKTISLPSTLKYIGTGLFRDAENLEEITIPENVQTIFPNTFHENTIINFPGIGKFKGSEFNLLFTKHQQYDDNEKTKIYMVNNNTYYVKIDNLDVIKTIITDPQINQELGNDKLEFLLEDKLGHNFPMDKTIRHLLSSSHPDYVSKIINLFTSNFDSVLASTYNEITKKLYNYNLPTTFIKRMLQGNYNLTDIFYIAQHMNNYLYRFLSFDSDTIDLRNISVSDLTFYTSLLEKYQNHDRFLFNTTLFKETHIKLQDELIECFNKNIKNLIINSKALEDKSGNEINELLKLCHVLGVFDPNEILSQKMCTFLNEKVIQNKVFSGDLHMHFDSMHTRLEVDYEFIKFFVSNFNELIEKENNQTGYISNIYNYFPNISKTSTSNKGKQRHLLVTMDIVHKFFLNQLFPNISPEDYELSNILNMYYTDGNSLLNDANKILSQSYNAPRNIFINSLDINDASHDLKEEKENCFVYEWLPKQDYRNLVLGKIVNCCAHLISNGAGIMRASMVADCCQNLVIKYNNNIVAKMTLYVNKDKGYGVYNTAEVIYNIQNDNEALKEIYNAFIRGTEAFINTYNQNNIIPITNITIGTHLNDLEKFIFEKSPITYSSLNYADYRYYIQGNLVGNYNGDDKNEQAIVYKKEIK